MKISEKEFAKIVRENKTTIYTVCYMFSDDREEVEDLFQEVLIALWQGLDSFRGESALRSWIYRISLNTCISADRKKRRRADSVRLDMKIDLFADTNDDTRQVQMLRSRIGKLGVFDRAIILLWLENLSYEEIGAIVGISAKNVSVRLVRIREQLKNMSNE
ncbi:MAG: sigma-70 family RNA polymerase sigma factor [Alistipes sp.]|nr:sigma-70 family RNA polymerase sigma factor [Alistipes sp.]